MPKKFWLRTALASAAVTVPLTTAASTLPPMRDAHVWTLAHPPALPEFGYVPGAPPPVSGDDQPGRQFRIDIPAGPRPERISHRCSADLQVCRGPPGGQA